MALGGVFMADTDGNIGGGKMISADNISGLLFDISKQSDFFSSGGGSAHKSQLQNTVIEVNSEEDLEKFGIVPYTPEGENNLLYGIPHYHASNFFEHQPNKRGRLFIAFADCSENWDAVEIIQNAAHGLLRQLGVWTEQSLWSDLSHGDTYTVNLVTDLQEKAEKLATENAPLSILLAANSAVVKTSESESKQVELAKIPACVSSEVGGINARRVSVLLGQECSKKVTAMHVANSKNNTPVGTVGSALGCLARAAVHESIAWVGQFPLTEIPAIEMGFGDVSSTSGDAYKSTLKYESLTPVQLDTLDDKGYIFLCKYAGIENGVYFSKDQTCSAGDYRTIARNRTIDKSKRMVRQALLPYVNSPLRVDPATGHLSAAKITAFTNILRDIMDTMQTNGEISGYSINIDPAQDVLKTDTLMIQYSIVPVGVATRIEVTEGLALSNSKKK